jgi:hypothetical protein
MTILYLNSDIAVFTPLFSPRVLDDPEFSFLVDVVAISDYDRGVCRTFAAVFVIKYSPRILLE